MDRPPDLPCYPRTEKTEEGGRMGCKRDPVSVKRATTADRCGVGVLKTLCLTSVTWYHEFILKECRCKHVHQATTARPAPHLRPCQCLASVWGESTRALMAGLHDPASSSCQCPAGSGSFKQTLSPSDRLPSPVPCERPTPLPLSLLPLPPLSFLSSQDLSS